VFTVTLSKAALTPVTVSYVTSNGSAVAPGDYTTTSGTLTFVPGTTVQKITVAVVGGEASESDESFTVTLNGAVNASISDGQAVGTIFDDEGRQVVIDDTSVLERHGALPILVFTLTLSRAALTPVTVSYVTSNSSAVGPEDYTTTSGTVTFLAGTTSQSITVAVVGDETVEGDESFFITLESVTNATIGDGQAVGTIFDDDAGRQVVIDDATVLEGDSGTTSLVFTLTLSRAALTPVTVSYVTSNSSAVAPEDYATTSGSVTFLAGTTNESITVGVVAEERVEGNESFLITLKSATNATIGDGQASGTIFDDDAGRQVVIDDARMVEGDSGTTSLVFTLTLSRAALTPVTVNFVTSNSSAVAPGDYATTSGTVTFLAGTTSQSITVGVVGD